LKASKWESHQESSVAEEAPQSRGFSQEDDPTYAKPSSATISLYSLLLLLPHSFPSMCQAKPIFWCVSSPTTQTRYSMTHET